MNASIKLGKILGIPIRLHFTWFIIFALVTLSLSLQYFPQNYPHWSKVLSWVIGISTSLLFFASVIAHELSHSVVSSLQGVPVKSITLFIFGGVARISREADKAGSEFRMAIAGPLSSLVIGGIFGLILLLARGHNQPLEALSGWLFRINLALAAFNLIPGFPLDGGRVLRAILWRWTGNMKKATRIASWAGQGVAFSFILVGIGLFFITGDWFSGVWLAFIGWFLENAASSSYKQVVMKDMLTQIKAGDALITECDLVRPNINLKSLVTDLVLPRGKRCFVVMDEGLMKGMVTLRNIKSVPQGQWVFTDAEKIMTPLVKLDVARPDEDASSLMERMDELDVNQIPVVSGGRFLGLVTREGLLKVIKTRLDLRLK